MKQIEVQIMGQSYLLGCPEGGEAALRAAVERVDGAMNRIRDAGKVKARDRIAVLAALNLAFELAQRESEAQAAAAVAQEPLAPPTAELPADVSEPAPASQAAPAHVQDAAETARAAAIVKRLDQVLAGDGHLL